MTKVLALDHATQLQEVKAIMGQPEFALGSVHAITHDGTLVIASALGSQLTAYAWGAANVMFVVGAQKLVHDLAAARDRVYQHSLKLEDARARKAYGMKSRVGKILEIHEEDPGRIHVVLIRAVVGFDARVGHVRWLGRVRGSPKCGNTLLSANHVISAMALAASVSTSSPYGRAMSVWGAGK